MTRASVIFCPASSVKFPIKGISTENPTSWLSRTIGRLTISPLKVRPKITIITAGIINIIPIVLLSRLNMFNTRKATDNDLRIEKWPIFSISLFSFLPLLIDNHPITQLEEYFLNRFHIILCFQLLRRTFLNKLSSSHKTDSIGSFSFIHNVRS